MITDRYQAAGADLGPHGAGRVRQHKSRHAERLHVLADPRLVIGNLLLLREIAVQVGFDCVQVPALGEHRRHRALYLLA